MTSVLGANAMKRQRYLLLVAVVLASLLSRSAPLSAQGDADRFVQDVISPLLVDTVQQLGRGMGWAAERHEPLTREKRCFALNVQYQRYKQLGYLRTVDLPELGNLIRLDDATITADLIRSLLQRCREEAEIACNTRGDVNAVVQAVRSMATIRTIFASLDPSRDGSPVTSSFRRGVGDDDMTWAGQLVSKCGQFLLKFNSSHEHECKDTAPNWRFTVSAEIPVFARLEKSDLLEALSLPPIVFEQGRAKATFEAIAPGKQKEGIDLRYSAIRPIRDAAARILGMRMGDEEPGGELRLEFSPPNAHEATIVVIPGVGQKPQDYQHWRAGYLSAYSKRKGPSSVDGDEIVLLDGFEAGRYPEVGRLRLEGRGTPLSNTEDGCIPIDRSQFLLTHRPGGLR